MKDIENQLYVKFNLVQSENIDADDKGVSMIEGKIDHTEEALELWNQYLESARLKNDKQGLVKAFHELDKLHKLIDKLYAKWIELDELAPKKEASVS
ncbi:MAG: hypothetical protein AB8E15_01625 [Bdellovibrionales bacterium]